MRSTEDRQSSTAVSEGTREIAERYGRLSTAFAAKIEGVAPDGWGDPTPCDEWNVRDLVGHVTRMCAVHLSMVGRRLGPGPTVEQDPLAAFKHASDRIADDLADPVRSQAIFDGRFGRWTFAEAIDRAVCNELAIHGWDLARATGQDERIDPSELPKLWASLKMVGDKAIRNPRVSGPEIPVDPDADEQNKLLSYVGRKV
ncbi:TIGR03086 family metal-binding protein [Nocardia sp. NPDC057668]|uniref:TIGR03086 family metal-binding protein n=1 Tax=Nocardia sp. NPDC057668 TaxID=3346202 RepID=UPI0036736007